MTGEGRHKVLVVSLQPEWDPASAPPSRRGLLAADPRVRTLLRVLVSYPEVRHVLPDRVSVEAAADTRVVETIGRFLERQSWLITRVAAG
ncbi:MAG TPA: hypothetical protein VFN71_05235 [Methylomirabilota bacterium]|nr:hypothetical protein [Methylomirabilota bacterium]